MNQSDALIEKIVLNEIEGKNRAIHAYDSVVWKIRTGFLTLLFAGWAILLKGIVEGKTNYPSMDQKLPLGMLLFSGGIAFGAWFIDRNYTRRKFRVIHALDLLTDELRICSTDLLKIPSELLKVAGDNGDMPYNNSDYQQAMTAARIVYMVPLIILAVVIVLI